MPDYLTFILVAALLLPINLLILYPKRGLLARWKRARQTAERVLWEDALKHIHRFETHGRQPSLESLAGALDVTIDEAAQILNRLAAQEWVQIQADEFWLTPSGHEYALRIIRAHRLWERYLAEETGFTEREWHPRANQYEHLLSQDQANDLSATLGHPTHDPHGDPIPTASGELRSHGGKSLPAMDVHVPLRIVHIEDEPEAVYAQLVKEGLHPGMEVQITKISPQVVRFLAGGKEHALPPILATNISVLPMTEPQRVASSLDQRLSTLHPGQKGRVVSLSPATRRAERRRLMDLGIIPGTIVKAEFRSPMGDPMAYRVREALIALRREQADMITIAPLQENDE